MFHQPLKLHFLPTTGLMVLLLGGIAAPSAWAQRDPELIVEVDRDELYLGESLLYNVTVNNVEQAPEPVLGGSDNFKVEFVGRQSQNSQQITIINGRRSEIVRFGMLYQYRLTPRRAGPLTIPAPTATVAGEVIAGPETTIRVIAPEEQEIVFLDVSVDRDVVYPLQEFTLTLSVSVRSLPDPLADRSPLSVQPREPVSLTVPWLQDESLSSDLEPQQSWREILEPLANGASRRREVDGMQINQIGTQSAFSFFNGSRKAVFLPQAERSTRTLKDGTTAGFWNYKLTRSFKAKSSGEYVFPPSTIKGTFGTAMQGEQLDGDQVYAVSSPVSVRVKPVPLDGKPPTFTGGIGIFDINADITPREAAVGDPMTLSVTIYGEGTVSDLRPPDISMVAEIAEQFRLYDSTEATVANGKVFTWSIRPLDESVTEFPPIPLSYFDVEQEEYVSRQSLPIPLSIAAASQLSSSDIVATTNPVSSTDATTLEVNEAGLFANFSDPTRYGSGVTRISDWLPWWIGMTITCVILNVALVARTRRNSAPGLSRRKSAKTRATKRLTAAMTDANGSASISPDTLNRIIAGLIADLTNKNEDGLTSADVLQILTAGNVKPKLVEQTREFLDQCDAARYGTAMADVQELATVCENLIDSLNKELSK